MPRSQRLECSAPAEIIERETALQNMKIPGNESPGDAVFHPCCLAPEPRRADIRSHGLVFWLPVPPSRRPSHLAERGSGFRGFRPRLQRRVRNGFTPFSLKPFPGLLYPWLITIAVNVNTNLASSARHRQGKRTPDNK
jgi:hypothetical protein